MNHDRADFRFLGREMLYEIAWREPLSVAAPKFGISDVAFKKRCKVLGVPTPPRGHWAKVESGKPVKQPALPREWTYVKRKPKTPTSPDQIKRFIAPAKDYSIVHRSPIVTATRKALLSARLNDYNLREVNGPGILRTKLARENLERGMWLWSELIPILKQFGLRLDSDNKTVVTDGKQSLDFELKEMTSKYIPNAAPSEKLSRYSHRLDQPRPQWQPRGVLLFRCDRSWLDGATHEWRDTPSGPLDDKLVQVAEGIKKLLDGMQAHRDRQREEERRRVELRRIQEIEEERLRVEREKVQLLSALADNYSKSVAIKSFLREIRVQVVRQGLVPESVDWLFWADRVAETINPVPDVVAALRDGQDPLEP